MLNLNHPDLQHMTEAEQAAIPLFNGIFNVAVREKDRLTSEDIERFGLPANAHGEVDQKALKEWRSIWITINDMIEYRERGASVRVLNHEDTREIFQRCERYLLAWKDRVERAVNLGKAADILDDLMKINRFAQEVYGHAVIHFPDPQHVQSDLMQAIAALGGSEILVERTAPGQVEALRQHPERRSDIADVLTNGFYGRAGF